jgi:hypothetical protein
MNDEHFLKKLITRFSSFLGGERSGNEQDAAMQHKLLHMIEATEETELPYEEVFELLDRYVELALRHEDAANLMLLVNKHNEICKDCREEYEALARVIEYESSQTR